MPIDGDLAATGLIEAFAHLATSGDWWTRRAPGVVALASMVPVPTMNGVLVEELTAPVQVVAGLLDGVDALAVPYSLQLRPGSDPALAALGRQRGMELEGDPAAGSG